MTISNDMIIYSIVFVLSFITFYAFIRIGVKKIAGTVTDKPILMIGVTKIAGTVTDKPY